MFETSFVAIVLLVAGVIILFKTVRMVPQGYEWTVERFGKYTHTMTPGLHFLVPVMYGVGRKINMMEQVMDVPSQDVITKDNAVVKVDGVVYFQVLDAAKAAYDAPFPDEPSKAGARAFPQLVPIEDDKDGVADNIAAWEGLAAFDRPFLTLFGESDPRAIRKFGNLQARFAKAAVFHNVSPII